MDIKTGALNDNKPRKINYKKGNEKEDTNPNLLTSKRRSIFIETSDNIENKIEENLNSMDSNKLEIDNTATNQRGGKYSNESYNVFPKFGKFITIRRNEKPIYTNKICKLLVDSGA